MPLAYIPKTLDQAISLMIDIQRDIDMLKGNKGKLSHKNLKDIEDHAGYARLDGSRPFTSPVDMGGNKIKNSGNTVLNIDNFSDSEIIIKDKGLALNYGTGKKQINTDKVTEGTSNLYLTAPRVGAMFVDTPTVDFTFDAVANTIKADVLKFLSNVYTPTRSAEANLDANVTFVEAHYMRVVDMVIVSGVFTANPTAVGVTSFEMSLPIASNIANAWEVAGVAFCGNIAGQGAQIAGVVANDTAKVQWIAVDVTNQSWTYIFGYKVI